MNKKLFILLSMLAMTFMTALAQRVSPLAYYTQKGEAKESNNITDGEAPLSVTLRANPSELGEWTPSYEWHFRRMDASGGYAELLVRYEEDTEYTFTESGTYNILLKLIGTEDDYTAVLDSQTVVVVISESKLEFPNAFSPNNDGYNDIYQAKKEYKSIVEFHGYIFNRWGQKLFEWTDVSTGWDGTYNGRPVKDGVYFALIKAKGADGRVYNFKRDVNLLRGYSNEGSQSSGSGSE